MTVSPSYNEATGEVSYEDAEVYDHSGRQHAIEQHQREQEADFENNSFGPPRHRYADLDHERVQQITESDYVENEDELDYIIVEDEQEEEETEYDPELAEVVSQVYELTGGQDNYTALITWACDNLDQSIIDEYDSIMDSRNPEQIYAAVNQLKQLFFNNNK